MRIDRHGEASYALAKRIYPIYRSITGNGVRETFQILKEYLSDVGDLIIHEIPTGTQVFDWTIPKEWIIRDAFIEDETGKKIIQFSDNCLHVVGYSLPVDKWIEYEDLIKIIHTQPDQPDVVPYVTSYYEEQYGFCMSETQKKKLKKGRYHIYIDSELFDGSLSYAELRLHGKVDQEVLFSTYSCHPSMGNDNCSGLALQAELAKYVGEKEGLYYSYRFVFLPETIGAIAFLAHKDNLKQLRLHCVGGYTLSCVGDDGYYSIIKTRSEKSLSDRILMNVLKHSNYYKDGLCKEYSYLERGSDERQYNSPGVGLKITGFCRSKYWEFPEYHTSLDTIDFISSSGLQGSFNIMRQVIECLEYNKIYMTKLPCEPQLGKRGMYPNVSQKGTYGDVEDIINFIGYADGKTDLVEISDSINVPMERLILIAEKALETDLIVEV